MPVLSGYSRHQSRNSHECQASTSNNSEKFGLPKLQEELSIANPEVSLASCLFLFDWDLQM